MARKKYSQPPKKVSQSPKKVSLWFRGFRTVFLLLATPYVNILIGAQVFCWPKIINPLGHKTILRPSAEGWFCVLCWNKYYFVFVYEKNGNYMYMYIKLVLSCMYLHICILTYVKKVGQYKYVCISYLQKMDTTQG